MLSSSKGKQTPPSTNSRDDPDPTADAIINAESAKSGQFVLVSYPRKSSSVIIPMDLEEEQVTQKPVLSLATEVLAGDTDLDTEDRGAIVQTTKETKDTSYRQSKMGRTPTTKTKADAYPTTENRQRPATKQYELRSMSKNRKLEAPPPDTQESMMFQQRRTTKKVYTSHFKAIVDQDGYPPPNGDHIKEEKEKDAEISSTASSLSSLSSPLSGKNSMFSEDHGDTQGKRKYQKSRLARSTPGRQVKRKMVNRRHLELTADLPSSSGQKKVNVAILSDTANDTEQTGGDNFARKYKKTAEYAGLEQSTDKLKSCTNSHFTEQNGPLQVQIEMSKVFNNFQQSKSQDGENSLESKLSGAPAQSSETSKHIHYQPQTVVDLGRGQEVGKKLAAALNKATDIAADSRGLTIHSASEAILTETTQSFNCKQHGLQPMTTRRGQGNMQPLQMTPRKGPLCGHAKGKTVESGVNAIEYDSLGIDSQRTWSQSNMSLAQQKIQTATARGRDNLGVEVGIEQEAEGSRHIKPDKGSAAMHRAMGTPRVVVVDRNGSPRIAYQKTGHITSRDTCPSRQRDSILDRSGRNLSGAIYVNESGYDGDTSSQELVNLAPDASGSSEEKRSQHTKSSLKSLFGPQESHNREPGLFSNQKSRYGKFQSAPSKLIVRSEQPHGKIDGDTALLVFPRKVQSTLLTFHKDLQKQLDDETSMVSEILDAYGRQCHNVLDKLFEAQDQRIRLCEQQIDSIEDHHAKIRQELIDRLQSNGVSAPKRRRLDLPTSQERQDTNLFGRV